MAPKVIAVCCVFDDDSWLPVMVDGLYEAVDGVLFLVAEQPWNGGEGETASTLEAIVQCPDPGKKLEIVRGPWRNETDQRNAGLDLARERGAELCLVADADEIYDTAAVLRMLQAAEQHPEVGAFYVSMFTYWKTIEFRIDPPEHFTPVVLVRPALARFVENRHVRTEKIGTFPPQFAICHHLSYARTDEQVQKKLARFSHSHEIVPGWYQNIWLGWDLNPEMPNLHPVYPAAYGRAVRQDPARYPPALRRAFDQGKTR